MKYHKINLMEYKGKLEGVALTNTDHLPEPQRIVLLKGGNPLIPQCDISSYAQEAQLCAQVVTTLLDNYLNKPISEAKKFCSSQSVSFCILTD